MKSAQLGRGLLQSALAFALVFAASPAWSGSKYAVLHNFTAGKDGALPFAPPTLDVKGNVYGTTNAGGGSGCEGYGCGTVFELTRSAKGQWREDLLLNFTDTTGGASSYGLIFDNDGELFGGTVALIAGGPAPIFKLTHGTDGWRFHIAYKPGGLGLVFGDTGSLYGFIGPGKYQCGAISGFANLPVKRVVGVQDRGFRAQARMQ
jgi:hypothetical protein